MQADEFQEKVLAWFDVFGRKDLPWQQDITPYKVWISEIMLQQTQVSSVIPYFNKFTASFPNLETLAAASLDSVLQHWAGLGYYARARNIHKTAQMILAQSRFPDTLEDLIALPGIGRSTAGAILSIAFKQQQAILDGNVKRVLARFYAINGWTGDPEIERTLWRISTTLTPAQRTADYTQAMMDLGATLCKRSKPDCQQCPVQARCQAWLKGKTDVYPMPKPRKVLSVRQCYFLLLINEVDQVLLIKRPAVGIWGGLWSLPECLTLEEVNSWIERQNFNILERQILLTQRHTFSHFHLDYTPLLIRVKECSNLVKESDLGSWYKGPELARLALPVPISRLLQEQFDSGSQDGGIGLRSKKIKN